MDKWESWNFSTRRTSNLQEVRRYTLLSKKLVTGIVVGTVALALIGAGAIVAQIIPEEEIKEFAGL